MAQNPYRGQQGQESYEHAWDVGYKYGYAHPQESDFPSKAPGPSEWGPLDGQQIGWLDQVWAEGALAGAEDGRQYGHQVTINPEHTGGPHENPVAEAGHVADAAHLAYDAVKLVRSGFAVAELGATAVGVLIFLICATEDPEVALTEPQQLGTTLAKACANAGCSEFWLPYCTATGHSGGSDGIFREGLWHGPLYYNEANAEGEAYQHVINERHWDHCGVLHYSPNTPDEMDWAVYKYEQC
jgi:hypothetical protein